MKKAGILAAWGLLVILAVHGADGLFGLWRERNQQWNQAQEQLRRMKGWLDAEQALSACRDERLGPFARLSGPERVWMSLQGFQQVAQGAGVTVTELNPFEIPSGERRASTFRLDAKVMGTSEQMSRFLQRIPEAMPGVRMGSLQLIPREDGQIRGLLRLDLFKEGKG